MTNEDKQILLKDLCARLPYGVIIKNKYSHIRYNFNSLVKDEDGEYLIDGVARLDEIEIYLRPMSSMDVIEKEFMNNEHIDFWIREDYCNCYHFDYRGLIPMGLALEALENMYKED